MRHVLTIDFGSTYTKVAAIDLDNHELLGTASAYTTIETSIEEGLGQALSQLQLKTGALDYHLTLACSSAAGGLRMIASGLVPSLTATAAKMACYGAGAKVVKSYAYQLNDEDLAEIEALDPDIFLLAGGTDGGNQATILHNAGVLARSKQDFPILLAGNRNAAQACQELLKEKEVYRCSNVMPAFGKVDVAPVQEKIRELFLEQIIQAKGLEQAASKLDLPLIPTPAAVLLGMELLARGTEKATGIGELLGIDVGGATTDIYSMSAGMPKQDNVIFKGVPEPFAKRTVEGDIGMRYSANGIAAALTEKGLADLSGLPLEEVQALMERIAQEPEFLPGSEKEAAFDEALAAGAVKVAVERHAGTMEEVYTPMGISYGQTGKDLRAIQNLVLTGGSLIANPSRKIVQQAFADPARPQVLKPITAKVYVDKRYILAAMGLLSQVEPDIALEIMKKELIGDGFTK